MDTQLKKTNTPNTIIFYGSSFSMLILIIISIVVLYTEGKNVLQAKSSSSMPSGDIFLIVLACLTLSFLAIVYFKFPAFFRSIILALSDSSYLIFLVLYISFVIILYENILTPDQVKEYAYFTLPITIIFAALLFFLNIKETIGHFLSINQTTERIKYSIIYFCLIVFLSLLYFLDPNNYISQYLGPYLVISILLTIFGFLYLLTLMSFPAKSGMSSTSTSLLSRFNPYTIFSVISFILFLISITVGIVSFPGGFMNSCPGTISTILILTIFVSIAWIISFVISLFLGETTSTTTSEEKSVISNYTNIFQKILLLLFGLTFSGLLIYWLVVNIQSLSSTSSIVSFILNLFIIIIVLGIIFKLFTTTSAYHNSPLIRLVANTVLYIPCIFVTIVDKLSSMLGLTKKYSASDTGTNLKLPNIQITDTNTSTYFVYLGILAIAVVCYVVYPYLEEKVTNQGGLLLVNQPVYLNNLNNLASYQTLNQTNAIDLSDPNNPMQFNYNYAISFWVFLDSKNPSNVNEYVSILNYGNNPNILFNPTNNTLIIMMNDLEQDQKQQVLYEDKNISLQKWNHILVNYSGSILDIFINGELVKSLTGVIPYKTLDILQIGSNNGIQGGICNVNYFNKSINIKQVQYLYHFLKERTPPTHSSSPDTIMNILEQVPNIVTNKPIEISSNTTYLNNLENTINNISIDVPNVVKKIEFDRTYDKNYISLDWYFKNNKY